MFATAALITILAAFAFLTVAYYFRSEIAEKMNPPQRVPVPVRIEEDIRRHR